MKRRLVIIAIFLLLGAVVNVAVLDLVQVLLHFGEPCPRASLRSALG